MTKREMLNKIMAVCANDAEIVGFCGHELELLDRKKYYKSDKPTKRQVENGVLKERIAEVLTDEGQTVTQILGALGQEDLTNQRVSALLRQMIGDGKVAKEMVKGKALFTVA